jgi:DNA-binding CsgD family transcriptional regulator
MRDPTGTSCDQEVPVHGDSERQHSTGAGLDLYAAAADLTQLVSGHVVELLAGRPTPGFRRLGVGIAQIDRGLTALEPTAQRSVWTMHPILGYDPANEMTRLDDHTRRRGVDLRCITTERSLNLYPLLTSEIPHVHFGPARSQFILVDESVAVVGGPHSEEGYPTAWLTTRSDVITRVRAIWELTSRLSHPGVPSGQKPPFTARQCQIARRLVLGAKDSTIARDLDVSLRTVTADVAVLLHTLGAGSRAEAAHLLVGGSHRLDAARLRANAT